MITVSLKPSPRLAMLLAVVHSGAIFLVFYLRIQFGVALAAPLVFSMVYSIMRYAWLSHSGSIVSLKIGDTSCTFFTRGRDERSCIIQGSSYVSPWLTVLNLKVKGRLMQSAVILSDAMDRQEFRQLRIWLRWKYQADAEKIQIVGQ